MVEGIWRYCALLMLAAMPDQVISQPPRQPAVERRNNERTMENFARCVVDTMPRWRVEAFLAADPFTHDGRAVGAPLAQSSHCLHAYREMFFSPPLFHSVLYEALYRTDYAQRAILPAPDQPALDFKAEVKSPSGAISAILLAERSFGDCVARRAPAKARAFVLADLYGSAEDKAIDALVEPLSACTNTGQKLAFSRPVLRGILAEALYKLTVRMPAAAASSTL